jgi:hypothetical protein
MTTVPETPLRLPSFHFTVTEEWVARQKLEHHTIPEGITIVSEDPTPKDLRLTCDQLLAITARLDAKIKRGAVEHNNPTPESNDMYLPNVASLSSAHVDQLTDVVQNMIGPRRMRELPYMVAMAIRKRPRFKLICPGSRSAPWPTRTMAPTRRGIF